MAEAMSLKIWSATARSSCVATHMNGLLPEKSIETTITIDELNQAILLDPRNGYERYNAATNGTDKAIYTYMALFFQVWQRYFLRRWRAQPALQR